MALLRADMQPVLFVADFTTNHMGNLNVLLRMVERAKAIGCDYIKMQKKDVETFYPEGRLTAPYLSPYGKTYREYRTIFEFEQEDYDRLDKECRRLGVRWFSTIQDLPSLHFMLRFDVPFYKIASCNARNRDFLAEVALNVPKTAVIIISVAGSTLREIEESVNIFADYQIHLLHCVAQYPCPSSSLRLGNINVLRTHFGCDQISIGYSGHEEGYVPTLAAIDLGARMVERHVCLSRYSFVHHMECSLEPEEYGTLVDIVRSGADLKALYASLPECAFNSQFGMSVTERRFLVEGVY